MAIPNAIRKAAADATGDLLHTETWSVVIQITEYSVLVLTKTLSNTIPVSDAVRHDSAKVPGLPHRANEISINEEEKTRNMSLVGPGKIRDTPYLRPVGWHVAHSPASPSTDEDEADFCPFPSLPF